MRIDSKNITLEQSIIKTMAYYDLFHYPLKAPEVFRFLTTNSVSQQDVKLCLDSLAGQNVISRFGDFYTLQKNESDIKRRVQGNKKAEECLPLARKQGDLISKFPFVRAVFASGSLSKGYMDEDSDLDFFIITEPGRLWICRAILALYKRVFLGNSHKYFCVNYFIDHDHLEIEEKNLFTATELATLIPLYGYDQYVSLMESNRSWLYKVFPNFAPNQTPLTGQTSFTIKPLCERIINIFFGKYIDRLVMRFASWRWRRLYSKIYSQQDFVIAFKTGPHVSKNHPRNFQKTVMEAYKRHESFYLEKLNSR